MHSGPRQTSKDRPRCANFRAERIAAKSVSCVSEVINAEKPSDWRIRISYYGIGRLTVHEKGY
jgi:hypothetical protein